MFGGSLDWSQFRSKSSSLSVLLKLERQTHILSAREAFDFSFVECYHEN